MFELDSLPTSLGTLDGAGLDDAQRIDQIACLERVKAAAAAAQVRITSAFDDSQRAAAAERGVPVGRLARGIADQVALARRESPAMGSRHLALARALVGEMSGTLAALTAGETTEHRALLMVKETAALSVEDRRAVDAELGPRLAAMGDRETGAEARRVGYRLDPYSMIRRTSRAEGDRCVTIRPAPDCMSYLTAHLPIAQGVAVWTTLRRHAESLRGTGDERSLGQLMADTLVERVTGLGRASTPPVEVHLVMTDRTLVGLEDEPAEVQGYGPIPAWLARRTVREAQRAWIRRLFTRPTDGQLVATDSRRRKFSGVLRELIVARDRICRTTWCDAPIRHADHVREYADGGATSLENAEGLCERCNYAKQVAGWVARGSPDGSDVEITTPTGHTYASSPPWPPGRMDGRWLDRALDDVLLAWVA